MTTITKEKHPFMSSTALLVIFSGIIFLCWLMLSGAREPMPPIAHCETGKLGTLLSVKRSEHSTTVNHFQVTYTDNGQINSTCTFFSQIPFTDLQKLQTEHAPICIIHDANKTDAVGILRPHFRRP